jgi:hypothetical protein
MIFNFKNKIVPTKAIEFTPMHPIATVYPPEPIKKFVPEWYKQMETKTPMSGMHDKEKLAKRKTIKKCVPVLDYMTSGYVIRSLGDISISRRVEYGQEKLSVYSHIDSEEKLPTISDHSAHQFPLELNGVKKCVMKFNNYIRIKTPPGYSCLFYQPFYMLETRFTILPGIVDTDDFNIPVSFPFYVNAYANEEFSFDIPAGTPLVCVMPFKRDDWQMNFIEDKPLRDANMMVRKTPSKLELKFATIMNEAYKKIFYKKKSFN